MKCTFRKFIHTISPEDVGSAQVRNDKTGLLVYVGECMGRIQGIDVGKRVYLKNDIVQVENDAQYRRRIANVDLYRERIIKT
jgi:hypothetical protein